MAVGTASPLAAPRLSVLLVDVVEEGREDVDDADDDVDDDRWEEEDEAEDDD